MQDLVAELRLKYDYIVVDASPLLAVANPLTLAPKRLASYGYGFGADYTYGQRLRAIGKY